MMRAVTCSWILGACPSVAAFARTPERFPPEIACFPRRSWARGEEWDIMPNLQTPPSKPTWSPAGRGWAARSPARPAAKRRAHPKGPQRSGGMAAGRHLREGRAGLAGRTSPSPPEGRTTTSNAAAPGAAPMEGRQGRPTAKVDTGTLRHRNPSTLRPWFPPTSGHPQRSIWISSASDIHPAPWPARTSPCAARADAHGLSFPPSPMPPLASRRVSRRCRDDWRLMRGHHGHAAAQRPARPRDRADRALDENGRSWPDRGNAPGFATALRRFSSPTSHSAAGSCLVIRQDSPPVCRAANACGHR